MPHIFWNTLSHSLFHTDVATPRINHNGALPCVLPVSELLAESVGLAGVALANLRGQSAQDVVVDGRLCGLWAQTSCAPIGWTPDAPWDPISSIFKTTDGWIRLHANAAHHKAAAATVLGDVSSKVAVADVISRYKSAKLEDLIVQNGGAAAQMICWESWKNHPQGTAISTAPLIEWSQKSAQPSDRLRNADYTSSRPLHGLKVLDLTRVLAGPVATRMLAGYGAQVLRIDPQTWDDLGILHDTTLGKRCAALDLKSQSDREVFNALLSEADVLVHGYRPGALAGLGYDPPALDAINPSLIEVSLSAYGWLGPWAERRGFDSLVQLSSGIADICKKADGTPGALPVQALDHATGYIMAACVFQALAQAKEGKVMSARTSLARVAWMLCNQRDKSQIGTVAQAAGDADYTPETEQSDWGNIRRLHPPVMISGAPMQWGIKSGNLRRHKPQWHERP